MDRSLTLALLASALLLGILPLEHTAALRNLLLSIALSAWAVHRSQQGAHDRPSLQWPLALWWIVYLGIAIVGLVWAVNITYSVREIQKEIFFGAIFFWLGVNLFTTPERARWAWAGILIGNALLVAYCLIVWLSGGTTKDNLIGTYQTGVGNFSTYLATVAPLLGYLVVRGWRKSVTLGWSGIALLIANVLAMIVTQNRQVLVAVLTEIIVVALLFFMNYQNTRHRRIGLVALLIGIVVLGGLFQWQMRNRAATSDVEMALKADGRLPAWQFAVQEGLKHPWQGAGFGRDVFKQRYPDAVVTQGPFVHTHNLLVNRFVQLGAPGVLAFLALWGAMLALMSSRGKVDGTYRELAVVGIAMGVGVLVKNMSDDFFMRELGYLYWLLCGVIVGLQSEKEKWV